jgi:hypothetical protein
MEHRKNNNDARLVPLTTVEQFKALQAYAAQDGHIVVCPSHLVMKGSQIVGYGSIGSVPMLNTWVHSKHVNKFESLRLLREAETMLAEGGAKFVILPVAASSPFRKFVGKLGYTTLGDASYNIKRLKPQAGSSPSSRPSPPGEGELSAEQLRNGTVQTSGGRE